MSLRSVFGAGLVLTAVALPLPGQSLPLDRMVIARNVVCREQPDAAGAAVGTLRLGDRLRTTGQSPVAEPSWYRVANRTPISRGVDPSVMRGTCWVSAPLTVEYSESNPGPALVRVAERVLGRDDATFEDLVAVENLFAWEPFASLLTSSARLSAARLRVIDRAASKLGDAREPLTGAWLVSHLDVLTRSGFGPSWRIVPDTYWDLYDEFEGQPGAEEIAWAAAQAPVFADECFTDCILSILTRTYMEHWRRFPTGLYVAEGITAALERVDYASRFCILIAAGEQRISPERALSLTEQLRSSLEEVRVAQKDPLLDRLDEIRQTCVPGIVDGLDDPRAIPALARAVGLGFRVVERSLAAFGDQAAPAVLEVVNSQETSPNDVYSALRTLRFMIEGAESENLSTTTRDGIRQAARRWLIVDGQNLSTLGSAIDLAIVLEDPDLRSIVALLAEDPNEVIARGVDDPGSVESIQVRAARRLAGEPPLPRP